MASRMGPGGRPGGARFAQFKLVLLGSPLIQTYRNAELTRSRRVCRREGVRNGKKGDVRLKTNLMTELFSLEIRKGMALEG